MEFAVSSRSTSMLDRLMRSKLFVPGSRPSLFEKAIVSSADVLSFDLEDSVVPDKKEEARVAIATFLREATPHNKLMIVRVNELKSEWFRKDMELLVGTGLDIINLPKVESAEQIHVAIDAIEKIERLKGVIDEVGLLANIETPKGLRLAFEIATASPRVMGLQIGFADFSLSCGIDIRNRTALNSVRLAVRLAAAEAGIVSLDGAFLDVKNLGEFLADAEDSCSLGFAGKSCIHPTQVPIANEVFSPKADEIARAESILAASTEKMKMGVGAFLHEGKMIDSPVISRARAVVSRADAVRKLATEQSGR